MNKWLAALFVTAGLVVIATITGVTAAMIGTQAMLVQQGGTEHPKANDGHGHVLLTGAATHDLPLYVAPVLDVEELFSVDKIRVTVPDREVSQNVVTSFHITRVTKVNSTAVVFYALGGEQIRVWNGVTTVRFMADGPDIPVCSANVTCAAFQVDSLALAEKYIAEAEASLLQFSEGRRRLAEACIDPLTPEQRTDMQATANTKCAETCENTCRWPGDGICSDGGAGSNNEGGAFYCFYGTDCEDCGKRPSLDTDCLLLSNQAKLDKKLDTLSAPSCDTPAPPSPPASPPVCGTSSAWAKSFDVPNPDMSYTLTAQVGTLESENTLAIMVPSEAKLDSLADDAVEAFGEAVNCIVIEPGTVITPGDYPKGQCFELQFTAGVTTEYTVNSTMASVAVFTQNPAELDLKQDGTDVEAADQLCGETPFPLSIAGYVPGSNVYQHNKVDLDQKAMEAALSAKNFTVATNSYATGANSVSKGTFRAPACGKVPPRPSRSSWPRPPGMRGLGPGPPPTTRPPQGRFKVPGAASVRMWALLRFEWGAKVAHPRAPFTVQAR